MTAQKLGTPGPLTAIDVSHHQGVIDWRAVAKNHAFAYVKATEGVGHEDKRYHRNVKAAQLYDMPVGAYHFARVSEPVARDAVAEARWFYAVVGDVEVGQMRPALDIEWDKRARGIAPVDVVRWVRVFLDECAELFGTKLVLYTGPNYWRWKLAKTLEFTDHPLWLASYRSRPPTVEGWPWSMWQYTGKGDTDGVKGRVDINRVAIGGFERMRFGGSHKPAQPVIRPPVRVSSGFSARLVCSVAEWFGGVA